MYCKDHPEVEAIARCAGCQESFCGNCLVDLHGEQYCGSCKMMGIDGVPIVEEATVPCEEAGEALKYAIIGIFCFGIILGPIAISKAREAKRLIEADPTLTGAGKASAAQIIGVVVIILWVVGMLSRCASMMNEY